LGFVAGESRRDLPSRRISPYQHRQNRQLSAIKWFFRSPRGAGQGEKLASLNIQANFIKCDNVAEATRNIDNFQHARGLPSQLVVGAIFPLMTLASIARGQ
jgi:hypothetical protein